MKIAIYPGSFNPIHKGHIDIIKKALNVLDFIIIAKGTNPEKIDVNKSNNIIDWDQSIKFDTELIKIFIDKNRFDSSIKFKGIVFNGLLKNLFEKDSHICKTYGFPNCIIKGLRNSQDFEYEKNQQYWNEDLGIEIPIFYIISDRQNVHISSSAIRNINKFKS